MSDKCKNCKYFNTKSKSPFKNNPKIRQCTGGFYNGSFVDPDAPCCPDFAPIHTVFHRITASPGGLAENFVYSVAFDYCYEEWYSTLFPDKVFSTKSEAVAATVARLKEVAN